MSKYIALRFRGNARTERYALPDFELKVGDAVVAETENGLELGFVAGIQHEEASSEEEKAPIIRKASSEDIEAYEANNERAKEAFRICRDMIQEHQLDMRLLDASYTLDGERLFFYFTSEGRVDFRSLVKDLALVFHRRIELRQIGIRDKARMTGGIGMCGRSFCCSTWLQDFVPVSVKMAKTQNLSMNPGKISGCCGRLMCCLKYEQDSYEDLRQRAPKVNTVVQTPRGAMKVMSVQLLEESVIAQAEGEEEQYRYHFDELRWSKPHRNKPESEGVETREAKAQGETATPSEKSQAAMTEEVSLKAEEEKTTRDPRTFHPQMSAKPRGEKKCAEEKTQLFARVPEAETSPVQRGSEPRREQKKTGSRKQGNKTEKHFLPHPVKAEDLGIEQN